MRYGSVCSGIEAATVAWHPLGWTPAFFSEIEKFPRAVLQARWPGVPLHGDFTTIKGDEYGSIDLLVGGTPCQSFSIAGLRGGLDDARGNLALAFLQLARRTRPRWLVWENVPGVLSSNDGRDFGSILGGMVELGYGFAYRILDAQYFGLAQRRRRVFVVGYLGDWRRAAAVLFERESLRGDSAPRRETGKRIAPTISSRPTGGGGLGTDFDLDGGLIAGEVSPTLRAGGNRTGGDRPPGTDVDTADSLIVTHALRGEDFDASEHGSGRGTPIVPVAYRTTGNDGAYCTGDQIGALTQGTDKSSQLLTVPIAYSIMPQNSGRDYKAREVDVAQPIMAGGPVGGNQGGDYIVQREAYAIQERAVSENLENGPGGKGFQAETAYTLEARSKVQAVALRGREGGATAELSDIPSALRASGGGGDNKAHVLITSAVRRLTPRECERLQGFPDDYTLVDAYARRVPEDVSDETLRYILRGNPGMEVEDAKRWASHPDGPRYKALGNSMAVPVMRWIGSRIQMVEALEKASAA